jgi:hypothetical protein
MGNLRKFSTLHAGTILLTALATLSLPYAVGAQAQPLRQDAQLAQAQAQNPLADPATGTVGAYELKLMERAMDEPRAIAAAVIAADNAAPKYIVDVGAAKGWFLEVFLDRFPKARGQWTESNLPDHTLGEGKMLLGRFGDRVDYKLGCTNRDLTEGCVPTGTDAIITEWLSMHQDLDGMYKIYRAAYEQLPAGGWVVNTDRVGFGGSAWEPRLKKAVPGFRPLRDGPPIEQHDIRLPTVDEQLGAMRSAGFDAQVVWQSFGTVLFMGRKN